MCCVCMSLCGCCTTRDAQHAPTGMLSRSLARLSRLVDKQLLIQHLQASVRAVKVARWVVVLRAVHMLLLLWPGSNRWHLKPTRMFPISGEVCCDGK